MLAILAALALAAVPAAPQPIVLGRVDFEHAGPILAALQRAVDTRIPEFEIVMDSSGGYTEIGYSVLDLMNVARVRGTKIICDVVRAESMAAILLETGCTVRRMRPGAHLLFHEIYFAEIFAPAKLDEKHLRESADHLADWNRRAAVLMASRMRMSADQYLAWISGHDRWVDSAEALAKGFVDEVSK